MKVGLLRQGGAEAKGKGPENMGQQGQRRNTPRAGDKTEEHRLGHRRQQSL